MIQDDAELGPQVGQIDAERWITMTAMFGAETTADDVLEGADLRGQRVLVTGVSAGVGAETARALATHGAIVVGTARNLAKGKAATEQVRAGAAHGVEIKLIALDLASLTSVRACADGLLGDGERFNAIIANAGVMAVPEGTTEGWLRNTARHQSSWAFRAG